MTNDEKYRPIDEMDLTESLDNENINDSNHDRPRRKGSLMNAVAGAIESRKAYRRVSVDIDDTKDDSNDGTNYSNVADEEVLDKINSERAFYSLPCDDADQCDEGGIGTDDDEDGCGTDKIVTIKQDDSEPPPENHKCSSEINEAENDTAHFAIKPGSIVDIDSAAVNPFALVNDEYYSEDEESFDEDDIDRYHFNDEHIEEVIMATPYMSDARSFSSIVPPIFLKWLQAIQSLRQEARRKRAEKALSMPTGIRSNFILCAESWCDLADRGMLLIFGLLIIVVFTYISISENKIRTRRIFLSVGITLIAARLLWRPLYWFFWGRMVEKKRRATMEMYDGLNGEAGTAGHEIPVHEIGVEMVERNPSDRRKIG